MAVQTQRLAVSARRLLDASQPKGPIFLHSVCLTRKSPKKIGVVWQRREQATVVGERVLVFFILFKHFLITMTSQHFNFFYFLYRINNFFITIQIKNSLQYKIFSLFYRNIFYFISHLSLFII
jgi:hypothetical protein